MGRREQSVASERYRLNQAMIGEAGQRKRREREQREYLEPRSQEPKSPCSQNSWVIQESEAGGREGKPRPKPRELGGEVAGQDDSATGPERNWGQSLI